MGIIFRKVKGFGLGRDAFAGVVLKFAALVRFCNDAALDAQNLIFIQFGAIGAIGAGFGHFFSEQHWRYLTQFSAPIIHQLCRKCYTYFAFFSMKSHKSWQIPPELVK